LQHLSKVKPEAMQVTLENVTKVYRSGRIETLALRGLSLSVRRGEFVAIRGPSGSGKTTLLNVVGLLETIDDGALTLDGRGVRGLDDRVRSRIRNEKIGFVFQSYNLIVDLDVAENVEVPLRYRGLPRKERKLRVERALDQVGMTGRKRSMPGQLSGGQQQRVAIARALVGDPELVLADEPTGNLDSTMADTVMRLFEEIHARGTTVVMVTHELSLARRAQRTVHILDGQALGLHDGRPVAGVPT
jgi:putative ABC transport system ATP-binding protein